MISNKMIRIEQYEKLLYSSHKICDELIKMIIQEDEDMFMNLMCTYKLNLVEEVYIKGIKTTSYNGYKRRQLRIQMLRLIELYNLALKIIEMCNCEYIECNDLYALVDICEKNTCRERKK